MTLLDTILTIVTGLFGGLNILQLVFLRQTRRKYGAEAATAVTDAKKNAEELRQSQYDYVIEKLTMYQKMYFELSEKIEENARKHKEEIEENARKHKEEIDTVASGYKRKIEGAWDELAKMKARVRYLQGMSCTRTGCPDRRAAADSDTISDTPADENPANTKN